MAAKRKIAAVFFNLGGPDSLEAVRPFLFNLFNDKAIIGLPQPARWLLARLISQTRQTEAKANYAEMGGKSPLLEWTDKQALAVERRLNASSEDEWRAFTAMRYWKPFTEDAVACVKEWGADLVCLAPLYPQFSTTTTGSSFGAWRKAASRAHLAAQTRFLCCYPEQKSFIKAHAEQLASAIRGADFSEPYRVLFSAHGLPEKVIEAGDPYQFQVEKTVAGVVETLRTDFDLNIENFVTCYQSRVGPLKWIGPSTDDEIRRAANDGMGIVLTPIAFVSEHIETLVELDIEYKELADEAGVGRYVRAPALGLSESYIEALADMLNAMAERDKSTAGACGEKVCGARFSKCPMALNTP
ncbi:MAG: ferrochelatase [Pseudomonadota bacterium]